MMPVGLPPAIRVRPERTFELLYALAYAGVFVSFIPFFSIFLPIKVQAVAPQDKVVLLSLLTIAGVTVASVTNILFGWLSDRTYARHGTRRPWIAAGLATLMTAYFAVSLSDTPATLVAAVLYFQLALNMLFSPLLATMADEIPDNRKGTVAGLTGTAHPLASLGGVLATLPFFATQGEQFILICLLTCTLILPLLIFGRTGLGRGQIEDMHEPAEGLAEPVVERVAGRRDLVLAWIARFCVQSAGTAIFTYSFYYFQHVLGDTRPLAEQTREIARAIAAGTAAAVMLTLAAGWMSDRIGRRKPFLLLFAIALVIGLVGMAEATTWMVAAASYVLFTATYIAFLALLVAFTMQILPSAAHRGRDLGIFNLTNTIPEGMGPLLALPLLAQATGYSPLLLAVAMLAGLGGLLVMLVRERA